MWLAYVILLPDGVHNFMRRAGAELFARYRSSESALLLEPHVTLKQPFEGNSLEAHEEYLDALAAELEPFELRMGGFATFEHDGVVFVDMEQDPRLEALQERIIRDLGVEPAMFESGEPVAYHFHGTVAVGLTRSQLEDVRATLGETPQFRFPLQRLGLFVLSPAGWVLRRRVTLRAAL